jgi:hypothetical protein
VAPLPRVVADFIDAEFELAREVFETVRWRASEDVVVRAEQFYRLVVERLEHESNTKLDARANLDGRT